MSAIYDTLGHIWPLDESGAYRGRDADVCDRCGGTRSDVWDAVCEGLSLSARPADSESLREWWNKVSTEDLIHAGAKAAEYGSADLEIMGKAMEGLFPDANQLDAESRRRVGIEMAIAFYNLGKAARMFGAYARGEVPSDDTWHDGTVYPMMARRVRESGRWP